MAIEALACELFHKPAIYLQLNQFSTGKSSRQQSDQRIEDEYSDSRLNP